MKLVNSTPKTVCVCIYHENVKLCCDSLHKHLAKFPSYGPELKRILTCNDWNKDCWFKDCVDCRPEIAEKKLRAVIKGHEKDKIQWWQWEKDETTNRTEKKRKSGTVKTMIDCFVMVYPAFLKHSFTNHKQSESFNDDNKYVDSHDDECLVQCDFAENHTNESQDEVTNAHWNQKQVSTIAITLLIFSVPRSKRSDFGLNSQKKKIAVTTLLLLLKCVSVCI